MGHKCLSRINTFSKQIHVYVGNSGGVWIDADVAREDAGEAAACRARQVDADAWLKYAVAIDDDVRARGRRQLVEWMRQCSDQLLGCFTWQLRVGIQRDDITYVVSTSRSADLHFEGGSRSRRRAAD